LIINIPKPETPWISGFIRDKNIIRKKAFALFNPNTFKKRGKQRWIFPFPVFGKKNRANTRVLRKADLAAFVQNNLQ